MGNWWPEVGDPPDECCPVDWGEYGFSVSVFSFGASGGGGVDEFDEVSCGNDMVGDDDVSRIGEWLSSLPEVTPEVTPEVIDWTFWFCSGEDLKSSIGETAFGLWAEEFSNEPDDVSDDDEHGFDDGEPTTYWFDFGENVNLRFRILFRFGWIDHLVGNGGTRDERTREQKF